MNKIYLFQYTDGVAVALASDGSTLSQYEGPMIYARSDLTSVSARRAYSRHFDSEPYITIDMLDVIDDAIEGFQDALGRNGKSDGPDLLGAGNNPFSDD